MQGCYRAGPMTTPVAPLAFAAAWTSDSAEADLRRFGEFIAAQGVAWAPSEKEREFVRQVVTTGSAEAGRMVEIRLTALVQAALKQANDPRRLVQESSSRAWSLLTPDQVTTLRAQGRSFEKPFSPVASLATIPITLGAYFGATAACDAAGLPRELSWAVALVAYVVTHRLVRGRWPLQTRR